MKTLGNAGDLEEVRKRISLLTPDSQRVWGEMSVGGMICHLRDAYEVALGERVLEMAPAPLNATREEVKRWTLQSAAIWPRGMKASQEVRQEAGGSSPGRFEEDQARLLEIVLRFSGCPTLEQVAHPSLGSMSNEDWLRWGYLHADHHLRQFSA